MLRSTVSWPVCFGVRHPSGAHDQILITIRQLRVCWFGVSSRMSERVCNLQLPLGLVSTVFLGFESSGIHDHVLLSQTWDSPIWRAKFLYLFSSGTGWPRYTPGNGFSRDHHCEVEVEVTLQLTISQSACQGIELTLRLVARCYFLSFCQKVYFWKLLSCLYGVPSPKSKSKLLYDWQSVSQSVSLFIEHPCGTCDQILFPVGMFLSEISGLVSMGRPLWPEDESAICNVITQWSESLRTRNHILLSHLRLPQPGGPGSRIYIPQEQGGPVKLPGTGFPLRRLLRLAVTLNRIYPT
jgi:hypothetical protein